MGLQGYLTAFELDGFDAVEIFRDRNHAHDVVHYRGFSRVEAQVGGETVFGAIIGTNGFCESEMEIRGHILNADNAAVASAPGGVVTTAVRHPQDGGFEHVHITQAKPEVALIRETDRAPSGVLAGAGGDHDEVFKTVAGGVAGDVGGVSGDERDRAQVFEFGTLFEGGVSANGRVFELIGKDLAGAVGAQANVAWFAVRAFDHRVMAKAHGARHAGQRVAQVDVGLAVAELELLVGSAGTNRLSPGGFESVDTRRG